MNEQQLKELYDYLQSIGQHGGVDYNKWAGSLDDKAVGGLYRNMSKAGLLDGVDEASFRKDMGSALADYKKKNTQSEAGLKESLPLSETIGTDYSKVNLLESEGQQGMMQPLQQPTIAEEIAQKPKTIATAYTGEDDPLQAGIALRKEMEKDYDLKQKYATDNDKARRDLESLQLYGNRLDLQAKVAKNDLSLLFGKDWEAQLEGAVQSVSNPKDEQQRTAALELITKITETEPYKNLQGAMAGYGKAQQAYVDFEKNNPEYFKNERLKKLNTSLVDAGLDPISPAEGLPLPNVPIVDWAKRLAGNLAVEVVTLPRTLSAMIPETEKDAIGSDAFEKLRGLGYFIGSIGDQMQESQDVYMPKPTAENRPLFENIAKIKMGAKDYEVAVSSQGEVERVYERFANGRITEVQPTEKELQYLTEQAPALAKEEFTGYRNLGSQAFDVIARLAITRGMAGGSAAKATAASFAMAHNNYYKEAIRDMNMSQADAAQYALTAAGIMSALEIGVGGIETRPLSMAASASAKSLGKMEARALVGKMTPGQIAAMRLWPAAKDIIGENGEEILTGLSDKIVASEFNQMTGSSLQSDMTPDEIKETILLTTVVTAPMSFLGGGGIATYQKQAFGAAVASPERFAGALSNLVDSKVISPEEAQQYQARIEALNIRWKNLPPNLSDNQKTDIITLQAYRDDMQNAVDSGQVIPAQAEKIKQQIKDADAAIAKMLEGAPAPAEEQAAGTIQAAEMPTQPGVAPEVTPATTPEMVAPAEVGTVPELQQAEPAIPAAQTPEAVEAGTTATTTATAPQTVPEQPTTQPPAQEEFNPFAMEMTVSAPKSPTVEAFEVERATKAARQAGVAVPASLSEVVTSTETKMGDVQQAMAAADTIPNQRGEALKESYIDEMTQTVIDQSKGTIGQEQFPIVRQIVAQELPNADANEDITSFMSGVNAQAIQGQRIVSKDRPLWAQLDAESPQDDIALKFLSGERVDPSGSKKFASKGWRKDQKGTMLKYTQKGAQGIEQMATDIADKWGIDEIQAEQMIWDFIEDNLDGPGEYARRRIAEQSGETMREMEMERGQAREAGILQETDIEQQVEAERQKEPGIVAYEDALPELKQHLDDQVSAFLDNFVNEDGTFDIEQAVESVEGFDGRFLSLAPQVQELIESEIRAKIRSEQKRGASAETIKDSETTTTNYETQQAIGTATPEQGQAEPNREGVTQENAEPLIAGETIGERIGAATIAAQSEAAISENPEVGNIAETVIDAQIDQIPVNQNTAPQDIKILQENGAPDDLIQAVTTQAMTPLTPEQVAQVKEYRKQVNEDTPDPDPDSVAPTSNIQMQADRIVVTAPDMYVDALVAAGGVYSQTAGGFVFKKNKIDQVRKIIGSRSPSMRSTMEDSRSMGQAGASLRQTLRNGISAPKIARILSNAVKPGLDKAIKKVKSELEIGNNPSDKRLRKTLSKVAKAFPNVSVSMDTAEIDRILKANGINTPVKGFVYQGKVYIDPRYAGLDTPVHEFGHIWNNWIKENDPAHYEAGINLMRGSQYEADIRSNPMYAGLSEEAILEEALATAIGEAGARMQTTSAWRKFKQWFSSLFSRYERATAINPKTMNAAQYADAVAKSLLGGKRPANVTERESNLRQQAKKIAVAVPGENGIQFQILGERGAAALQPQVNRMLAMAKGMEKKGVDIEDIWNLTGWYRGVDGLWRYEINSAEMTMLVETAQEAADKLAQTGAENLTLADALDYPTFFQAYPQARDIKFAFLSEAESKAAGLAGAFFVDETGRLVIMAAEGVSPAEMKSTLLHEIQHLVQYYENFAPGTTPLDVMNKVGQHLAALQTDLQNTGADTPEGAKILEEIEKTNRIIEKIAADATKLEDETFKFNEIFTTLGYLKTAGEVEARLVEQRAKLREKAGFTFDVANKPPGITFRGNEYYFATQAQKPFIFESEDQVREQFGKPAVRVVTRESIPPFLLYDVAPEEQIVFAATPQSAKYVREQNEATFQFSAASNDTDLATRQLAARKMIATEIQQNGQKDALVKIKKIGIELALDPNQVAHIWEQESKQQGFGRLDFKRGERAYKPASMIDRIMKFTKEWLTSSGLLGPEIKAEIDRMENNIKKHIMRLDYLMANFDRAVENHIKGEKPESKANARRVWAQIADNVMKGEADYSILPPEIADAVREMRQTIDSMSREIVRIGAGNHKFVMTVLQNSGVQIDLAGNNEMKGFMGAIKKSPNERTKEENMAIEAFLDGYGNELGTYLYRSYKVNDDPSYAKNVDSGVRDRARAKLIEIWQGRINELETLANTSADELQDEIDANTAKINRIVTEISDQLAEAKARMSELASKQAQFTAEKGRANLVTQRQINAQQKIINELSSRLRQSKEMAAEDLANILLIPGDDFNQMKLSAKIIAGLRRKNADLEDKILDIQSNPSKKIAELQKQIANVDANIDKILDKDQEQKGFMKRGKPGSKDLTSFIGRKDIPEEIRDLLGEYRDARVNFGKTMQRMATLIESQNLLLRLKDQFEGQFFFPPDTPVPGYYRQISSEKNPSMDPLNGWYTSPEIETALKEMYEGAELNAFWATYLKFVSAIRYGKTILSPVTHARNFVSNLYLCAINGYFSLDPRKGFGFRDPFNVVHQSLWPKSNEERQAEVERMTELGIISTGTTSEVLKKAIDELKSEGVDWDLSSGRLYDYETGNFRQRLIAKGIRGVRDGLQFAEDMYQMEDDIFKVMGYLKERQRSARGLYGKDFDQLTPQQAKIAEERAARIVRDIMPTYSKVPKAVQAFRNWPITGTFVAFPAEMFRTSKNTIALTIEEMRDPRFRVDGFLRLARIMFFQSMTFGAAAYAKALMGIDDEEDEAIRSLSKPWQQASTIIYTGNKNGTYSFINLGYTDPHNFYKKIYYRLTTDTDKAIGKRLAQVGYDLVEPFVSENLVWGAIRQAWSNKNEMNDQRIYRPNLALSEWLLKYDKEDGGIEAGQNLKDLGRFLVWQLQPGFVKTGEDLYMATTQESVGNRIPKELDQVLLSFAGLQTETLNPEVAVGTRMYNRSTDKGEARSVFTKSLGSLKKKVANGAITREDAIKELNKAFETTKFSTDALCESLKKDIKHARALGLTDREIAGIMLEKKFTKYEIRKIIRGENFVPLFKGYNK